MNPTGTRDKKTGRWASTVSEQEDERIKLLYETGDGVATIGKRIGRSPSFVLSRLRHMGVCTRPQGGTHANYYRIPQSVITLTKGLYERGYACGEIGEIMGCTRQTVEYRLAASGVPRRSTSEALVLAYKRNRRKSWYAYRLTNQERRQVV